jgi:hypothetical protein
MQNAKCRTNDDEGGRTEWTKWTGGGGEAGWDRWAIVARLDGEDRVDWRVEAEHGGA